MHENTYTCLTEWELYTKSWITLLSLNSYSFPTDYPPTPTPPPSSFLLDTCYSFDDRGVILCTTYFKAFLKKSTSGKFLRPLVAELWPCSWGHIMTPHLPCHQVSHAVLSCCEQSRKNPLVFQHAWYPSPFKSNFAINQVQLLAGGPCPGDMTSSQVMKALC